MQKSMLFIAFIVMLYSCGSSTKVIKTWQEPGSSVTLADVKKALVVGFVKNEASRRIVEDQLTKRLNGKAVQSYTVFKESIANLDESAIDARVKQDGYDYILFTRLADVEKETTYVPGSANMGYYGGYGRYYRYSAPIYYDPGYYQENKNYFIETTVYSVADNKLLWTGTTKTVNPSKLDVAINEIADAISDKMKKDGFLK